MYVERGSTVRRGEKCIRNREVRQTGAAKREWPCRIHQDQFSLSMERSRLTRDGTAESVSRDQILRREWGQGNIHFPCSADHEQIGSLIRLIHTLAICEDHTYMSRLTQDGTAEPVSRNQIFRREWEQGNIHFPCSADHEQDWQPFPVDLYSAIRDGLHT